MSLGSAPLHAFFAVVLPNIQSGLVAAFILAFITSFNNVPVSLFLTGPGVAIAHPMLSYMEYYYDHHISTVEHHYSFDHHRGAKRREAAGISKYV